MKVLSLIVLGLTFSVQAMGGTFKVFSLCDEAPYSVQTFNKKSNLLVLTEEMLVKANIPHEAGFNGIKNIFDAPTGLEALEVISDKKMRAYGWCFSINGEVPELYASDIEVSGTENIEWFYGYAFYNEGEWLTQCEPAHLLKPDFLCK